MCWPLPHVVLGAKHPMSTKRWLSSRGPTFSLRCWRLRFFFVKSDRCHLGSHRSGSGGGPGFSRSRPLGSLTLHGMSCPVDTITRAGASRPGAIGRLDHCVTWTATQGVPDERGVLTVTPCHVGRSGALQVPGEVKALQPLQLRQRKTWALMVETA